jgi:hypothetical protein
VAVAVALTQLLVSLEGLVVVVAGEQLVALETLVRSRQLRVSLVELVLALAQEIPQVVVVVVLVPLAAMVFLQAATTF